MNSEDLMRLGPAAQKQVMDKMRTREYAMKAKQCRSRHGFAIREV